MQSNNLPIYRRKTEFKDVFCALISLQKWADMQRHLLERHDCILEGWEASLKYLFNVKGDDLGQKRIYIYMCV